MESVKRDSTYGFSWPQRNYTCSFCNKKYMSAQALGGHMNVHRRDRAKLRESPSSGAHPSPNPNPNPNSNHINSSSSTTKFLPYSSYNSFSNPSLAWFSPLSSASKEEGKMYAKKQRTDEPMVLKEKENSLKLDLSMGLIREAKEDLDLELRLGCS